MERVHEHQGWRLESHDHAERRARLPPAAGQDHEPLCVPHEGLDRLRLVITKGQLEELEELRKKSKDDEEAISMLRTKVEESR